MLKKTSIERLLNLSKKLTEEGFDSLSLEIETIVKEGMVSKHKQSLEEIEEQLETSIQKYYQTILAPNDQSLNHWLNNLESSLINLEKANFDSSFRRGYIYHESEIDRVVNKINSIGFDLACEHLYEYSYDSTDPFVIENFFNETLRLEDLYTKVGRAIPNFKTKYKQ